MLYRDWLESHTPNERIQRLYLIPDLGNVGIQPWDDGTLKIAVETVLHIKAGETAISNASLWSQVYKGKPQKPSKMLMEHSVRIWENILKILKPEKIVTSGKIAKEVIVKAGGKPIEWAHPSFISRIKGLFSEQDLLHRYHEVVNLLPIRPEWFLYNRRNKILFACHAVSLTANLR